MAAAAAPAPSVSEELSGDGYNSAEVGMDVSLDASIGAIKGESGIGVGRSLLQENSFEEDTSADPKVGFFT